MSELVEQAMVTLSARCNLTALHPNDEDTIKSYLKALHKHGEDVSPSSIAPHAQVHNWTAIPLKQLLKWSEAISTGGRVQIKNKAFVQSDKEIITFLQSRLDVN